MGADFENSTKRSDSDRQQNLGLDEFVPAVPVQEPFFARFLAGAQIGFLDNRFGLTVLARGRGDTLERNGGFLRWEKLHQLRRGCSRVLQLAVEINSNNEAAVASCIGRRLWIFRANICCGEKFRRRIGPIAGLGKPVVADLRAGWGEFVVVCQVVKRNANSDDVSVFCFWPRFHTDFEDETLLDV